MKKIAFILLLIFPMLCKAQLKTLTFDFAKKSIESPSKFKIKSGDYYTIQYKNVNPYLYNISYKVKDSFIKVVEPASFTAIFDYLNTLATTVAAEGERAKIAVGKDPKITTPINELIGLINAFLFKCQYTVAHIYSVDISATTFTNPDIYTSYTSMMTDYNAIVSKQNALLSTPKPADLNAIPDIKPLATIINQMIPLLLNFKPELYQFTTLPIQMKGGYLQELAIKFEPADSIQKKINILIQPYEQTLLIRNNLYFDYGFSTGIYTTNFNHDVYSNKPIYDSIFNNTDSSSSYSITGYQLIQENSNKRQLGLHVLAFAGVHFNEYFSAGVNMGPGITFEKTPRLLGFGGIYIGFGNQSQFHLGFGYAGGSVNKLANNNASYTTTPSPAEITNLYTRSFAWSPYWSLTYSFPFVVKESK